MYLSHRFSFDSSKKLGGHIFAAPSIIRAYAAMGPPTAGHLLY